MIREICFDTETTGLNPFEGHRLIEIGCVELIDGKKTNNFYHQLINPERDVPEEAVKIHNITAEILSDKPKFRDIVQDFLNFIQDSPLIAHNAGFDMKFINFELNLANLDKLKNEVVDSLMLAKSLFPGQKNNLDALCKRFNIDNTKRAEDGHGALLDAELLADVYIELNGGSQKSLIKEEKNIAKTNIINIKEIIKNATNKQSIESRKFDIPEYELEAHKKFIEKYIKNSLWN